MLSGLRSAQTTKALVMSVPVSAIWVAPALFGRLTVPEVTVFEQRGLTRHGYQPRADREQRAEQRAYARDRGEPLDFLEQRTHGRAPIEQASSQTDPSQALWSLSPTGVSYLPVGEGVAAAWSGGPEPQSAIDASALMPSGPETEHVLAALAATWPVSGRPGNATREAL